MVERKTDNLEAIGSSPIMPNNSSASQRCLVALLQALLASQAGAWGYAPATAHIVRSACCEATSTVAQKLLIR